MVIYWLNWTLVFNVTSVTSYWRFIINVSLGYHFESQQGLKDSNGIHGHVDTFIYHMYSVIDLTKKNIFQGPQFV